MELVGLKKIFPYQNSKGQRIECKMMGKKRGSNSSSFPLLVQEVDYIGVLVPVLEVISNCIYYNFNQLAIS